MESAIITGGSGYVGRHLINHLLDTKAYDLIVIADITLPQVAYSGLRTQVQFIYCDVRESINANEFRDAGCGPNTVIYNLAAICRIPGFPTIDYFRTNILGAENVCELAEALGISRIIFTSSVSPYGKSEELKREEAIPQPDDAYGSSKLTAEYIHRGWQQCDPENRMLTILRPGIIFGEGEQANFTRLYESQKKGFFVYPGRKDTKKACVYVKDVARACRHFSTAQSGIHIYNLVYSQAPSIEEICTAVADETDARKPLLLIPGLLLIFVAQMILIFGKLVNKDFSGIHPDRVKKVMMSTNISGEKLAKSDFELTYSLRQGINDWFKDCDGRLA